MRRGGTRRTRRWVSSRSGRPPLPTRCSPTSTTRSPASTVRASSSSTASSTARDRSSTHCLRACTWSVSPPRPSTLVAGALDREHDATEDAFSIINRAYGDGGALVQVDGQPAETIHIVDVAAPGGSSNASASRVVIEMAAGSSATVVETRIGHGDAFGGSNVRTEISLAADASLEHIILQDLPTTQIHLGRVDVIQEAGSTLRAAALQPGIRLRPGCLRRAPRR